MLKIEGIDDLVGGGINEYSYIIRNVTSTNDEYVIRLVILLLQSIEVRISRIKEDELSPEGFPMYSCQISLADNKFPNHTIRTGRYKMKKTAFITKDNMMKAIGEMVDKIISYDRK